VFLCVRVCIYTMTHDFLSVRQDLITDVINIQKCLWTCIKVNVKLSLCFK
jgi:hypothetical protein